MVSFDGSSNTNLLPARAMRTLYPDCVRIYICISRASFNCDGEKNTVVICSTKRT